VIVVAAGIIFVVGLLVIFTTSWTGIRQLADALLATYLVLWGLYALLAKIAKEEICKRFLLTTGTVVCLLLLCELPAWTGFVDYRRLFSLHKLEPWNRPGYTYDEDLLWIHQPHYTFQGQYTRGNMGEYLCLPHHEPLPYDLKYDHNGFRNATDQDKADIVVIGDSYIESQMMPTAQLMTTLLGELESSRVVNLGVSGYGPQQELITLKRYGLPLQPKTVVWVFYEGNDLNDIRAYELRKKILSDPFASAERRIERSFIKNGLEVLVHLSGRCIPHGDIKKRYGMVRNEEGKVEKIYFLDFPYPLSPEDLEALDKTRLALAEAYQLCKARGIRFIVVFAPTKYRVYDGLPALVDVSDELKKWFINDLPERLAMIVDDISPSIEYLDLTPLLKNEARRGRQIFLVDDSHWAPEGHLIVAQALQQVAAGSALHVVQNRPERSKLKPVIDLTHDALMVRAPDGTIRYWSKGAERMYGWKPKESLGKSSHQLLRTIFPKSLQSIEAELNRTGRWEGELLHKRRDGSPVVVASRWELQRNALDNSTTVIEINSERPRAD
jgi:PAS domain S-box-containing protein